MTRMLLGLAGVLLSILFLGGVYAVQANFNKIDVGVFDNLDDFGRTKVIVDVRGPGGIVFEDSSQVLRLVGLVDEKRVSSILGTDAFVAYLSLEEIYALSMDESVYHIESDKKFFGTLQDSIHIIDAYDAWELKDYSSGSYLTGSGQTVCVVDSGIDFGHPDLEGKNVLGYNLDCVSSTECVPDPDHIDQYGHGTIVGGIVGADGGITGIGKGASLIGANVFYYNGGWISGPEEVRKAVNWCVTNSETYNISVITLSLGDRVEHTDYCDDSLPSLYQGIQNAVDSGISVVIATGNERYHEGINAPACLSNSIPVTASTKYETIWAASNYDQIGMVKLIAPGSAINSTLAGGGYTDNSVGGTSLSVPMVGGAIAIINQYAKSNGLSLTPFQIEDLLYDTGFNLTGSGGVVLSRIDIDDALLRIDNLAPRVDLVYPSDGVKVLLVDDSQKVGFRCGAEDWRVGSIGLNVFDLSSGSLIFNETRYLSGVGGYSEETYRVLLDGGNYTWGCFSRDSNGNLGHSENRSLSVFDGGFVNFVGNGSSMGLFGALNKSR